MKKDYIFVAQILSQPEPKEVKIEIPEGYEIDKEKSTFEKIVFKKKNDKPRSWEEYCKNHKGHYYTIDSESKIQNHGWNFMETNSPLNPRINRNSLPSFDFAEAFLAMMQLMSLRQAWIGDWEPDGKITPYNIVFDGIFNCIEVLGKHSISHPLSFPKEEMAEDFMNTFKDLLETAKPLI